MIRIDVNVSGEEAIVRLDTLPRRLRDFLEKKMDAFLEGPVKECLLTDLPGRFLDPKYIHTDVQSVGGLLIGSIEGQTKPGFYEIYPTGARLLRFVSRSGEVVFTRRVLRHPFLKAGPVIERFFRENKPWLIDQIEDFVFEAVYNAR